MSRGLPFDEKNAEDYVENTRKINEALETIESDQSLAPTKANLARLSGLNRNTLYNRSRLTCPPERKGEASAADFGWPYRRLLEIKKERIRETLVRATKPSIEDSLENKVNHCQIQLDKSRYVAGSWFSRALDLKKERDVARREADLLRKRLGEREKSYSEEVGRLRKQLQQSIKAVRK